MANSVGRPPIWTDPKDLEVLINEYFESESRPTLAGLAFALGIDRQTLYNYKKRDGFFDIIKRARDHVEYIYETRLIYDDKPTGVIFALKNMNWKDRSDLTTDNKPLEFGQLTDDQLDTFINSKIGKDKTS